MRTPSLSRRSFAAMILVVTAGLLPWSLSCSPSSSSSKTVADAAKTAVTVTDDACKIAEAAGALQNLPDWVTVACKVDGAANDVLIHMPKAAWMAAKNASRDAGPGK